MPLLATDDLLARDSFYDASAAPAPARPALLGSHHCDVAIVGGGLAGVSAALELAGRGRKVVLLEARQIGSGASGRNGGQAIHGLACDNEVIEAQLGPDDARRVWAMSIEALALLRERIARHAIDCEWQSGFLSLAVNARKGAALARWADRLETVYGYPLGRVPPTAIGDWIASPRYHSGVHDPGSGHLHPLKYARGLATAAAAAGARLHEHSEVLSLTAAAQPGAPSVLKTALGELHAGQVLLAGNVYLNGLVPGLRDRIMPVGTYIACTDPLDFSLADRLIPSRSAVCDTNFVLDYFRPTEDHRMLFGGRVSYSTRTPRHLAQAMRQRMLRSFPQLAAARIAHAWGGFVDITMNRAPDFGRLPASPSVYYLQGFSGHGLALTGLAGRLVAEAMAGDASRFDVFARLRHRPFPGGARLRTPALVLGMAWYRLRDMLG